MIHLNLSLSRVAALVRFERTHRLPCLSDFKSAPFDLLGTAPYKKCRPSHQGGSCTFRRVSARGGGYDPEVLFVRNESMTNCSAVERRFAVMADRWKLKSMFLPRKMVSVYTVSQKTVIVKMASVPSDGRLISFIWDTRRSLYIV